MFGRGLYHLRFPWTTRLSPRIRSSAPLRKQVILPVDLSFSSTSTFAHNSRLRTLHTMAQPVTLTLAATGKTITVPTGLFINNEFVPSVDSTEKIE